MWALWHHLCRIKRNKQTNPAILTSGQDDQRCWKMYDNSSKNIIIFGLWHNNPIFPTGQKFVRSRWSLCGRKAGNIKNCNFDNYLSYLLAEVTHRTLAGCNDQRHVRSRSGPGTGRSHYVIGWDGKFERWVRKSPPSQVECRWSWTTGCSWAWRTEDKKIFFLCYLFIDIGVSKSRKKNTKALKNSFSVSLA